VDGSFPVVGAGPPSVFGWFHPVPGPSAAADEGPGAPARFLCAQQCPSAAVLPTHDLLLLISGQ